VFAHGAGTRDIAKAGVDAVVDGTHQTFAVAAMLVALALGIAALSRRRRPGR
jgi:MYXO-CTERM domain-containing protein